MNKETYYNNDQKYPEYKLDNNMANYDRLQNDYDFQASFAGLIITGYIVANKKQLDPVGIENLKQAQGLINTQANDKIVKQMVKQIVSQSQVMF
ncbi:hypothetical protein [Lactobacillus crispatus]|uniref:hypothetical protein n=1 Tax=Lactobacillus crispatus TaxID=47770 RepID=UPI00123C0A1B|nr:hypothetical protein [Lactobacillus crispatus]KAA8793053.1 hypothetical protein F1C00_09120 [Lactobacillus crispatus]HIT43829.1 hypothetical protein [Candidatus Avacholeplasma faecigallinarum]